MSLSLKTANKEIEDLFNRLSKYPIIRVPPDIGMSLGRNKKIRYLREKDLIFLGQDRNKRKSIVGIPPKVKIKRVNGGFSFEFD